MQQINQCQQYNIASYRLWNYFVGLLVCHWLRCCLTSELDNLSSWGSPSLVFLHSSASFPQRPSAGGWTIIAYPRELVEGQYEEQQLNCPLLGAQTCFLFFARLPLLVTAQVLAAPYRAYCDPPYGAKNFSVGLALPKRFGYLPLVLSSTQTYLCDTPFCNVSGDTCEMQFSSRQERASHAYDYKYLAIWKVSLLGL